MLNASVEKLKAFAVLAFCAEMTRLPGHWSPRLAPAEYHVNHPAITVQDRGPHVEAQATVLLLNNVTELATQGAMAGEKVSYGWGLQGRRWSRHCSR